MVRPISIRLRPSEMRRHDHATVEKLRRIEVVDRRVRVLQAERQKLLAKRAEHTQDRDSWQFLYELHRGYCDSQSIEERNKALTQARAAAAIVRSLDRLLGYNADHLRRLAVHRRSLSCLTGATK
jgi:hypothetical protein